MASPGVEDVEGDVEFPRELCLGPLTEETLHHMFGFGLGLGHTKVGLGVLQGGGKPSQAVKPFNPIKYYWVSQKVQGLMFRGHFTGSNGLKSKS